MSEFASLAERLRPFEVVDEAVTCREFAEAWRLSEAQTLRILRQHVKDGRLRPVKTRREYAKGERVVDAYAEVVDAD